MSGPEKCVRSCGTDDYGGDADGNVFAYWNCRNGGIANLRSPLISLMLASPYHRRAARSV